MTCNCLLAELKKDKTDQANGSISPSSEPPGGPMLPSPGDGGGGSGGGGDSINKPERPSSLGGPGKLTRRLLCYHSEHCMSNNSPPRPNSLAAGTGAGATGECHLYFAALQPFVAISFKLANYKYEYIFLQSIEIIKQN